MPWLVDVAYILAAIITAPIWLVRLIRTGKIRTDWKGRFGAAFPLGTKTRPRLLIHAVSVGEVNAIRLLVDQLSEVGGMQGVGKAGGAVGRWGGPEIVISTTTNTGFDRAQALWGEKHAVVRYPFDLSWAVNRFLNAVQPDAVALVELEVWPNFTAALARRAIPVCVINGRLTARSFARYRRLAPLIRPSFRRLALAAVQDREYAARFAAMGVPQANIVITGTMKWDTARITDHVAGAQELADAMGIDLRQPLVVAGSTAPDEHQLLADAAPADVQLLCAPRKPEWFDHAAAAMPGCARRSRNEQGSPTGRFLLDTIGELRQAYALADLVVIGRSFVDLHGSDMMEPIALGKAAIVGPAVADFQQTVNALLAGDGLMQTTREKLPGVIRELLADAPRRAQLAANGRAVIRAHQGATARTAELLMSLLKCGQSTPANRR